MNSTPFIGFSQRIKLDWMEETARLMALGVTEPEIKDALRVLLKHQNARRARVRIPGRRC